MTDEEFIAEVVAACRRIPNAVAVGLGGSRARGDNRADSDWDFAVYYRGPIDVGPLEQIGWEGRVYRPFEWGQVMYGGAVFDLDGRHFDIHYRNLDVVEHWTREAEQGRFEVHILGFHLAGVPTYMLAGEVATNVALWGELTPIEYPDALQSAAPAKWLDRAGASACGWPRRRGRRVARDGCRGRAVVRTSAVACHAAFTPRARCRGAVAERGQRHAQSVARSERFGSPRSVPSVVAVSEPYWRGAAEDEAMQEEHGFLWRALLDTIDIDLAGFRVLDAGCNRGGFLRLLVDESGIAAGYGYDPASGAIDDARRLAGQRPLTFETAVTVPAGWAEFDAAFSHEVLYLLHDLASHAAAMFAALEPGAPYFAVMGVHAGSQLMSAWHGSAASELALPRLYDLDEVVEVFDGAGFEVSVARLQVRFVPVSARRGGHEHRRDLMDWLDYYERDKVLFRFTRPSRR